MEKITKSGAWAIIGRLWLYGTQLPGHNSDNGSYQNLQLNLLLIIMVEIWALVSVSLGFMFMHI